MFKSYTRINNHYNAMYIEKMLMRNPSIKDSIFVAQEKIHGANLQLIYIKDMDFPVVCSRTRILSQHEKFYKVWDVVHSEEMSEFHKSVFALFNNPGIALQRILREQGTIVPEKITIYGELFGGGVQKGVDYGPDQRFMFFDVVVDDIQLNPELIYLMCLHGESSIFSELVVPYYSRGTFEELMETDFSVNSLVGPEKKEGENICEGVVIKPYFSRIFDWNGCPFYIKKKNECFTEKMMSKKNKAAVPVKDSRISLLSDKFIEYITENRVDSVFSKFGPIEGENQIGLYIKRILEDAREEFLVENSETMSELDKGQVKEVYKSSGKLLAKMLKRRL